MTLNPDLQNALNNDPTLAAVSSLLDSKDAKDTLLEGQVASLTQQVATDESTVTTLQTQLSAAQATISQEQAEEAAEAAAPVPVVFDKLETTPWQLAPGTTANTNQSGSTSTATQGQPGTSSAFFNLAPNGAYADAYWYKRLAIDASKNKFIYEVSFLFGTDADAAASQCIELDIMKVVNKTAFNPGLQFNFNSNVLRVWDRNLQGSGKEPWISTGLPCPVWAANQWVHVILEAHHDATTVYYDAVTIGDVRHVLNVSFPIPTTPLDWSDVFNVAVQLDGNVRGTAYRVYLEDVKFTAST